ncbi:hypothetical protein [Alteromonas gracilis]|uniref:hypothetical protein n=1 Tax=Alteromonas gracilis TaxID=1479524 RepID=UPI0037359BCC
MNTVQTYTSFDKGAKRKDRREHLKLCGYIRIADIDPALGKPRELAMERLNAKSEVAGGQYHGVYPQDIKGMNGNISYSLYVNEK